ncbi:MAG: tRNA epoxyqueuosine(34) reductase QueG [Myxococcales bacterium]|nr:tRNA epoxyqueuosine(34) reductase QueG [Myxococcales bacterium]
MSCSFARPYSRRVSDPDGVAAIFAEEAQKAGFHRVGFASVEPWERHEVYRRWLASGYAGEMEYMVADEAVRRDPRSLLKGARTLVTVALSYAHPDPAPATGTPRAFIARYARGADYHMVMKTRLHRLAEAAAARLGRPIATRACVDTAPLLEREAAHRSGLGFLAKNTLIIAPGLGSYLLLGELLTDAVATHQAPATPRCGQCRACLDACPTGAFVDAYTLDARRCISYLTIEARGAIPRDLRPLVEDMVFGCDRCQEVCPFNAAAPDGGPLLAPLPGHERPPLTELLAMGAARFRKFVRRTALRRVHRAQLLRNVAVALGNVGTPAELDALAAAFAEPSPLVRAHVAWAIGRLGERHPAASARAIVLLTARRSIEEDPSVLAEIDQALA